MLVLMGLPIALVGMYLAACLLQASTTTLGLAWVNSLQELVPTDRLGRVVSIDYLGSYALLPVGFAVSGIAADRFGPSLIFLVGGILSALIIGLGLLHPSVHNVD